MPFFFLYDPTYVLVIIGVVISMIASAYVNRTFQKYNQVGNKRNITGREAARAILDSAGLYDITIEHTAGDLTDNYNPNTKTLNLSDATDRQTSVAAIGVAAHEAGHALQDQEGYAPMQMRAAIVPVVNIASNLALPILLIGVIFSLSQTFINIGLILFATTFIFQLVTLPVEFNASNRAIAIIEDQNLLVDEEVDQARSVLRAAALTYVAATFASLLNVLRLFLLFGGNRRNN